MEHYFEAANQREIFHKAGEHPGSIEIIKQRGFDPVIEVYIYHTLLCFDTIIRELAEVFGRVFAIIKEEQAEFLTQTPEFIRSFQSEENASKLKVLANLTNESLHFSLTLLDERKIKLCKSEPDCFLLGRCFADVLDTRYKYLNADPFSFAQAIGNQARYDIYQALLKNAPMTRAEMERKLHLSRSALDHNLNVMRERGLLVVDHQCGLSNCYRLDYEYIRAAAELMLDGVIRT